MEQFAPKRATKDINRLFLGFIKSVTETIGAESASRYAMDYERYPIRSPSLGAWGHSAHHEYYPSWDPYADAYAVEDFSWDPYAATWPSPAKRGAEEIGW